MSNKSSMILFVALALLATACGGGTAAEDAWSRGGIEGRNSAVYLDLSSGDGDTLLAVSVPADVAADAQLHETVMTDTEDMSGDDLSNDVSEDDPEAMGGMTMWPLDELQIPAGETVTFEPGGYHVMLVDLVESLAPGDVFDLTLEFETAGRVTVQVEVREE